VVGLVALLAGSCTHHPGPEATSAIPGLASDERPCPGFGEQMQRMQTMSNAEMVRIGAADMLPERGATTRARVNGALAAARGAYPSATVRVGPGLGVTYNGTGQTRITYHREPDYQLWVRFASAEACPSMAAFVISGDQRIPVFAVFRS
jgi:hypothetical protein